MAAGTVRDPAGGTPEVACSAGPISGRPGAVLSVANRAVLDWARARGAILIEDGYDAEFRYDRTAVGAMQGLAQDQVVTPDRRGGGWRSGAGVPSAGRPVIAIINPAVPVWQGVSL
jgi:hypothetical protein